MCTVSNIGDDWGKRWPDNPVNPWKQLPDVFPQVSRAEFDALKREVEALRDLLKAAKIYDEKTGQPDCHMDDKVALIKKIAKVVGVDLGDVFAAPKPKKSRKPNS